MSRTINGKTVKEVMEALAAPLPKEAFKVRDYDNKPYITVEACYERMDSVLGVEHYNAVYTEPQFVQQKDTYVISTVGTLEILDDNFEVIFRKSGPGTSTVTFPNIEKTENGQKVKVPGNIATLVPNDVMSAFQDAFKRICKNKLQIGAKQLSEFKGKPIGEEHTVVIKYAATLGEGKGFFTNATVDGKDIRFAIFSNKLESVKKQYPNGFKKGEILCVYGNIKKDAKGNDQLVFEAFSEESKQNTNPSTQTSEKIQTQTLVQAPSVQEEPEFVVMKTTGNLESCPEDANMMKMTITCNDTQGRLFFNKDGQKELENLGHIEALKSMGVSGIDISLYAKKKGNDYLFVSF